MNKVYVGNLPYNTQEDDLRSMFQSYGSVDSVDIIIDRYTGRSKGFGFVTFANANGVKAAIEGLDGKDVGGRRIKVSEAKEKAESQGRSDNRGGGYRSDRGGSHGGDGRY